MKSVAGKKMGTHKYAKIENILLNNQSILSKKGNKIL